MPHAKPEGGLVVVASMKHCRSCDLEEWDYLRPVRRRVDTLVCNDEGWQMTSDLCYSSVLLDDSSLEERLSIAQQ